MFTLDYGGLSTFYGGLDALVGPPSPQVIASDCSRLLRIALDCFGSLRIASGCL